MVIGNKEGTVGEVQELTRFFDSIREDPRIGLSHISVYMALFQVCYRNGFQNPIVITRSEVMTIAKINGLATYHKCIRDLAAFGYIRYEPSFHPAIGSKVVLMKI